MTEGQHHQYIVFFTRLRIKMMILFKIFNSWLQPLLSPASVDNQLGAIASTWQDWIQQEIVNDDPYDVAEYLEHFSFGEPIKLRIRN